MQPPHPPHGACRSRRVAQGEVAAVDVSDCGMYSLHLGAFTVRMSREALVELGETLQHATRSEVAPEAPAAAAPAAFMRPERGNA